MSETYPEEEAILYTDAFFSLERLTEQSIQLWDQHSKEYVEVVAPG